MSVFSNVVFAYLFGSGAADRLRPDSDIDVAIYGAGGAALDVESERVVDGETDIQLAVEAATGRNVDLLVLNRAPALVCASVLLTGCELIVRDRSLCTRFFLAVTNVAIEFLQTEQEFRRIRDRSASLSEIDRARLMRILDFIDQELSDRQQFEAVDLDRYRGDRNLRRNLDRWVETLINAAIDIGKIVLASEHRAVPQTYGQILAELDVMPQLAGRSPGQLRNLSALRNVIAHEYLDLRFPRIRSFVADDVDAIAALAGSVRSWLTE